MPINHMNEDAFELCSYHIVTQISVQQLLKRDRHHLQPSRLTVRVPATTFNYRQKVLVILKHVILSGPRRVQIFGRLIVSHRKIRQIPTQFHPAMNRMIAIITLFRFRRIQIEHAQRLLHLVTQYICGANVMFFGALLNHLLSIRPI